MKWFVISCYSYTIWTVIINTHHVESIIENIVQCISVLLFVFITICGSYLMHVFTVTISIISISEEKWHLTRFNHVFLKNANFPRTVSHHLRGFTIMIKANVLTHTGTMLWMLQDGDNIQYNVEINRIHCPKCIHKNWTWWCYSKKNVESQRLQNITRETQIPPQDVEKVHSNPCHSLVQLTCSPVIIIHFLSMCTIFLNCNSSSSCFSLHFLFNFNTKPDQMWHFKATVCCRTPIK